MTLTRWIRHLIEHQLPRLPGRTRDWLSGSGATLRRVGRNYEHAGRRSAVIAGATAMRAAGRFAAWSKNTWSTGRAALAENPALARRFVFGALLLIAVVTAIWVVVSNGQRSSAATPLAAAPVSTSSTTAPRTNPPAPAPLPAPAPAQPDQPVGAYTVVPGDTLAGIALRYGVPFEQLASRNGIRDPNKINVGTQLSISKRLPGTEVIQPGDALHTYSQRYGISEEKLTVLNPQLLKPPRLLAGAGIRVAAVTS